MTLLHDQAFGAKMPTYATILQLDRKLRAFPVPPVLQVAGFGSSEPRQGGYPDSVALTLQRHIVLAIREMSTFFSYILPIQITYQRNFRFIRLAVSTQEFLCTSNQRSPEGPSRQPIRNLRYRCISKCWFPCRYDAEFAHTIEGAQRANMVPLDTYVFLLSMLFPFRLWYCLHTVRSFSGQLSLGVLP